MVADAGHVRQEVGPEGIAFLPLGWREINDWLTCTRQDVSPTFLRAMIQLSGAMANQIQASRDVACQVPFDPAVG